MLPHEVAVLSQTWLANHDTGLFSCCVLWWRWMLPMVWPKIRMVMMLSHLTQ